MNTATQNLLKNQRPHGPVTRVARKTHQPRGGYIKPSQFEETVIDDGIVLGEENLHASIIGMVVDYLTRFMTGASVEKAFEISIVGYWCRISPLRKDILEKDMKKKLDIASLLSQIKGLDDKSIIAACKACTYDVWYRNPIDAKSVKGADETYPDKTTIENIKIMVNRSLIFWKKYGPITVSGFTFEKDVYTSVVTAGDGDYLTADTMWDFKVSKRKLNSEKTLQLLMYWIMGQHSGKKEFKSIKKLGIFNPRLNIVYLLDMNAVPKEVIETVERDVICY